MYPHSRIVGDSLTNENSPFQIGLESSRILGLYKPAVPDHQQDTHARTFRANSSGSGTSLPPYLLPYTKPFSGRPSWVINNRSYSRGWGNTKVRVWNSVPAAAACTSPRYTHHRGCRPSRASRLPTPGPATHCSGDWKPHPVPEASCNQKTHFKEAIQERPTQPLNCGVPASQTLTFSWALV